MTNPFETEWRERISRSLTRHLEPKQVQTILEDDSKFESDTQSAAAMNWTRTVLERVTETAGKNLCCEVLLECGCQYPAENLRETRRIYQKTGSLADAHRHLKEQFKSFLRNQLQLDEFEIHTVLSRGWGIAGILNGNTVTATKIPKSGNLKTYLQEPDSDRKKELYCHCPRIRQYIEDHESPPSLPGCYCCCGGGFYRGIWQNITLKPVTVQCLKSVLQGADICQFKIHIQTDDVSHSAF